MARTQKYFLKNKEAQTILDCLQIIYPEMNKEDILIFCLKTRWEIDANKFKEKLMAIMPKDN
jgi:hypothetical protein